MIEKIPPAESALVILVPVAEALVKPFREKHDPSAAAGMPAHITLLYPFLRPEKLGDSDLNALRSSFREFQPFQFSLRKTGRFPGVLYLAPDPDTPFRRLTAAISQRFPRYLPYGGRFDDPTPHLTVARLEDDAEPDRLAEEFDDASRGKLPIHATASQIALMEKRSGYWRISSEFVLGNIP